MPRALGLFGHNDYMKISNEDITDEGMNKGNEKNMTGPVKPRKKRKHRKHIAPADRWYTPIQLRPWVVRVMGYQPRTGKVSAQPRPSPFRQFIEEIVAAKIAEHFGAQSATRSSTASENVREEASAKSSTTRDRKALRKIIHDEEEALATLGLSREDLARQPDFASAAATRHILGVQNIPALHASKPKTPVPSSPRRLSHKGLMDWLMPDLPDPDPRRGSRRPTSTSASASIPVIGSQEEFGVRSDPKPENKGSLSLQNWDGHSRRHKNREIRCYMSGALNGKRINLGKEIRDEEGDGEREDVAPNDDKHEDGPGPTFKEGKSDDDDRPTHASQKGRGNRTRSEMSLLSSEERGLGLRTSNQSESTNTSRSTSRSRVTGKSRSTSRSRITSSSRTSRSMSMSNTGGSNSRRSKTSTSNNNDNNHHHHRLGPRTRS